MLLLCKITCYYASCFASGQKSDLRMPFEIGLRATNLTIKALSDNGVILLQLHYSALFP